MDALIPKWYVVAVTLGLLSLSTAAANAQNRTGGTSTSGFGVGGSSGGLSGSNSFGGGQNRFATTNANTASANQSVLTNQQSTFGLQGGQTGQNGFLGGRNTQSFLGANQRNSLGNNQQQQQQQFGNRGNRGGQNGLNDPNGFNQQGMNNQNAQDSRRAIRPQQKVAFEIPEYSPAELKTTLESRFERVTRQPALRGVTVDLDADGVVVLRGSVATAAQRQLAANMVRLEPGVKKIRNELTLSEAGN
jgi:hypothetical protein